MGITASRPRPATSDYEPLIERPKRQLTTFNSDECVFSFADLTRITTDYRASKEGRTRYSRTMENLIRYHISLQDHDRISDETRLNIIDIIYACYPEAMHSFSPSQILTRFRYDYQDHERRHSTRGPMGPKTRAALGLIMELTKETGVFTRVTYKEKEYFAAGNPSLAAVSGITLYAPSRAERTPHATTSAAASVSAASTLT